MPAEKHALLSASSAERWLHCPPNARLTENMPEDASAYAEEGRLAHAIAEHRLRKMYWPVKPSVFNTAMKKLKADPQYKPEMDKHVETYLDHIDGVVHAFDARPHIAVEVEVDFSEWVPEGFGTSDCVIIGGDALHVIDFKYGQGVPVSPEQNPQMMLYALGAIRKYSPFYPIHHVIMTICQPRLGETLSWATSSEDLLLWGESIKETAQTAFDGLGEYAPGDWCRFCKAKATCRARSDAAARLDFGGELPPLIDNAEIARRIAAIRPFVKILADLEDHALAECLAGREVPGFKAVEGRSNRAFSDPDAAFTRLIESGYDEALLYIRTPLTLSKVEDLIGKKTFAELLNDYITKPPGKPALVDSADKRPPITRQTAQDDFKEDIQ